MAADVVLPGPDGLLPPAPGTRGERRSRQWWTSVTLLVLGCVVSALCVLVVVGAWLDDHRIDQSEGHAVADVLSVSFSRTAVRFVTPDGTVVIPPTGVLYPGGLAAGERVRVEYDTGNTELVRVAGRDFRLSFLPAGVTLVVCWAIVAPLLWLLRRGRKASRDRKASLGRTATGRRRSTS